ncbi:hypothetical protein KKR91_10265 [Arthrobacter jiangjiafuii]|uniref:Lipoprotein n=1 Tax=Arthrobacter jiangjiafuii TaxID=2817475 RepID=A0A975M3S1_9MICC|nr:hypothetical protein [Arthrobacter jiangjiafuii]MBP3043388.1 hypothetical protein [Arthrobacter jiangjiafuii]QWC08921.1 hypothetical protein KKR91_10265 [Arthrobacter jiangjiafuii]
MALLPAAALALVLAGCTAQEDPEAAATEPATPPATAEKSATPSPSAGASGRNSVTVELPPGSTTPPPPNDPAMLALFRAEDPISLESYFQQQPQAQGRPLDASLVLEESGTGRSTFDVPALEPGTSFSVFLTCNQPGDYDIEVLDADSDRVTAGGSNNCNWPILTSFEHIVTPDDIPTSITVDGPDGDYWLVVYNLPVPTTAPPLPPAAPAAG